MFVRVAHWSRRKPVTHASSPSRCFVSGCTLRTLQQRSRFSTDSFIRSSPLLDDQALDLTGVGLEHVQIESRVLRAQRAIRSCVSRGSRPVSTVKTRTPGSILYAMSISATSSAWNAAEIAIRGLNSLDRPLEQRLRLLALVLDRELAGLQLVEQLVACSCGSLLSYSLLRRLETCEHAELVVGRRGAGTSVKRLARQRAARASRGSSPSTAGSSCSLAHAAEERAADLRHRAERAAHEDVVGGDAVAVGVLAGRRLEAEVADPVLRARVRAAVEVEAKLGDRRRRRSLEMVDELAEPLLRLADGEVAVRLAGAGDRVRPDLVRRERQTELVELRERQPRRRRRR